MDTLPHKAKLYLANFSNPLGDRPFLGEVSLPYKPAFGETLVLMTPSSLITPLEPLRREFLIQEVIHITTIHSGYYALNLVLTVKP